ncbi:hypothetical protein ACP4OV_020444 [Aristida adscensionis]
MAVDAPPPPPPSLSRPWRWRLLEALHLTVVDDPCAAIQRLVSGCPRLADLTLEACPNLKRLTVLGAARLRRLALRCFHHALRIAADGSELAAFDFVGGLPATSLLTLRGSPRAAACAVEFCGRPELSEEEEFAAFRALLGGFVGAEHLHLRSSRLCRAVGFPTFFSLRRLELSGGLDDPSSAR